MKDAISDFKYNSTDEQLLTTARIVALAGGIGAAKFLVGLAGATAPEDITIISNTGDDIELLGLRVSPDIDTVIYTLAGVINEETGWGVAGDTFECLKMIERLGGPAWFKLGDRDLATHIRRAEMLKQGRTLTEATRALGRALGVRSTILPMTDSYTPTRVSTDEGEMHFQEYFVGRRCEPQVRAISFDRIEFARPAPGAIEAIRSADAVLICPSNPFISIGPILAVPGMREAIKESAAKVIAISPIISGRALKGPAADMLRALGYEVSARGVAEVYRDLVDIFIIDERDAQIGASIEKLGITTRALNTVMTGMEDKLRLARQVMDIVKQQRVRSEE
jgi:LPPG:FO 2-phospho-L-lactate transferase